MKNRCVHNFVNRCNKRLSLSDNDVIKKKKKQFEIRNCAVDNVPSIKNEKLNKVGYYNTDIRNSIRFCRSCNNRHNSKPEKIHIQTIHSLIIYRNDICLHNTICTHCIFQSQHIFFVVYISKLTFFFVIFLFSNLRCKTKNNLFP